MLDATGGGIGLAVLTAADFRLELLWNMRAAGLIGSGAATLAVLWSRVLLPLRWWTSRERPSRSRPVSPARPADPHRRPVRRASRREDPLRRRAPSLVDALEQETDIQVQPLPLDRIVPWPRVWAVGALAAVPVFSSWSRRLVTSSGELRCSALLSRRPYTTVAVAPGNLMVDQGDSVPITVELRGRLKRNVVLYTRPVGQPDAAWKAARSMPRTAAPPRSETPSSRRSRIRWTIASPPVRRRARPTGSRCDIRSRSRRLMWRSSRRHTPASSRAQ